MTQRLGKRGADIIKARETLRLKAYMPTANDRPTIGWGSTRGVAMGMTITEEEAAVRFLEDTADAVREVVKLPCPLTPAMFDALVSLVFNNGAGSISSTSTIGKALRTGDYFSAWAGFPLWRKQRNKTTGELDDVLGLARRRSEEMVLFFMDGLP